MSKSPAFSRWIDTFVSEKELNVHHVFHVTAPQGTENLIPLDSVIAAAKVSTLAEQKQIKAIIVKIDFANGNVMHFFEHLAKGLAFDAAVVSA